LKSKSPALKPGSVADSSSLASASPTGCDWCRSTSSRERAELIDDADRAGLEASTRGARGSGTPFISFYSPDEMIALARNAGFPDVRHVSTADLIDRYFAGRTDGLRPSSGEGLIVART
jgi:hypothetical protein